MESDDASTNKILSGETMHFFCHKDGGLTTDVWRKGWECFGL